MAVRHLGHSLALKWDWTTPDSSQSGFEGGEDDPPHWHTPPTLPGAILIVGDPIPGASAVPPLPTLGRSSFFEWRPTHQRPEPSLAVSRRSSVDKGYRRIVSLERTAMTEAINGRFRITAAHAGTTRAQANAIATTPRGTVAVTANSICGFVPATLRALGWAALSHVA
jgi:hypothetical protein